ncbi:ATP-binding cassette domain-containing protein [Micromonospora sp. R77]|uniref:ATP-binding cassette domain-containing protein n=1 Tax=Micromonospora sp. R77 TaxID=2925836 RepID=UPI001F6236F0|nr:ATP-binding cassette domain-containing protein [Micromonospora sp. R77]MCI4061469.1 ATP-binding cassette domain-containing protein [Micromonospora sp. R77]
MPAAIDVAGLCKSFGPVTALDHLDLTVPQGTVHGLLGPNGAGKTTTVRVLSTLVSPDNGKAEVFGVDVRSDPRRVRSAIGLTGQYAAIDELLTGRENLHMIGRLFRLSRADSRARAGELLERLDLGEAADRQARTYSGGMRRRLDIATSLMARPRLIFLDEPTTGLDPRSRLEVWRIVRELVAEGTTVLLTTQYLEEADQLADALSVIDQGKVIACGTPDELKSQVGEDWAVVTLIYATDLDATTELLRRTLGADPAVDPVALRVQAPLPHGGSLAELLHLLKSSGIGIGDVSVRRPTLDDVFLAVTGRSADHGANKQETRKDKRRP